jgi:TM2 domain-containing membrane protein YozV
MSTTPWIAGNLTDEQRAVFYSQMSVVQKDEVVGVLLALFLGTFGAHHFYLRRNGLGIMYVLFCWTGIPTIASFIECFFMPARVRQFNAEQAAILATNLRVAMPGVVNPGPVISGAVNAMNSPGTPLVAAATCSSCGSPLVAGVKFCSRCGAQVAS